jgi:CheY-like chemotaxis protein
VELHGGTVNVASDGVGKGTELTVAIPLLAEGMVGAGASSPPPASALSTLAGIRVVVVDDEQDARDLVTAVLEQAGAIVTSVGSAEEAMHAIAERPPSLLVSDIGMPGEDGYALIARVRALPAESGGRLPAVAVTAFTRDDDRARALRAGYTAHVAKPIDPAALVTLVSNVTSGGAAPTN